VSETWTLLELVERAAARVAALPAPKNGQVRAVPDERTVRYYAAIGLLDRPSAMRGRTALYAARHLAQVVAIKRLQGAGKSLAEIQALWPTLDDHTLARMTGVAIPASSARRGARSEFWRRAPADAAPAPAPAVAAPAPAAEAVDTEPSARAAELRLALADDVALVMALRDEAIHLTPADVRALRAAAAPFVAELAKRGLIAHRVGTLEES